MTPSWADIQGHAVNAWQLDSFLGLRGAAACYEGIDPNGRAALVQVVSTDERGAGQMARSWDVARDLAEPHLLRVLDTGSTGIGDVAAYYAVLELPEDDLSELRSRQSIDVDEARGIVAAVATALEFLHSRGLKHGAVFPSNVMFAGGSPKLSVDTIAPADQDGRDADLQQLGATITEMIAGERTAEAAKQLPPALRDLVSACWAGSDGGWTAGRVADVASGRLSATPVKPPAPVEAAEREEPQPRRPPTVVRLRWPVFAAIALLLVVAIFALRRRTHPAEAPAVPAPARTSPATPTAPPTAPARSAAVERAPNRSDRSNSWAVVAATYADFNAAQKRAQKLRRGLRAHVYPPHGQGNRYYVLLGSGLTSAGARKLRARAMRMGAPRDTYVTILPGS